MTKSKTLILVAVVAMAVMLSSLYMTAYATNSVGSTSDRPAGMVLSPGRDMLGKGPHGFIEVSAEYEAKVISIAKSDSDVQKLLADGYNVTAVRPIIKTVVDVNGGVTMKATSAVVMLEKGTTGRASVLVNLDTAKVTQIVIQTRTVIDKGS